MPTNNSAATSTFCQEENEHVGQNSHVSEPRSYWFPFYEGLFEHAPTIRDAVWFFAWLIARTTLESDGRGKVLGGIPVSDDLPAGELGFPVKTVRRWRRMLLAGGYIEVVRTPYGFKYTLLKSKKWQNPHKRDLPKLPISSVENGQIGQRGQQDRAQRSAVSGNSNKTTQRQHKEEAEEAAAAASQTLKGKSNPQTPEGKSCNQDLKAEAWEAIRIPRDGSQRFILAWERFYAERPEGEKSSDTMEDCIQWCKANGIKPTPPFYEARQRIKEQERMDFDPSARMATGEYNRAESEKACARMEAEREKEREAAMARFDALSREEKVAELKAKLADNEQWLTSAKEAGKQPARWLLDHKAELERKIAEYSPPVCQEEISLSREEEIQLISQFPEAWDTVAA